MATRESKQGAVAPEAPPAKQLREMFRRSARALLENRSLRGVSSRAVEPTSALSEPELKALRTVGLSTESWPAERPDDPLAQSIVDYMALVETSLTTADAAQRLKCDVSRIRQRLRDRSLFGIEHEGEWRLPRFQLERNHALPGLAAVLAALPSDLNALDVAEWFLRPNPDLEIDDQPVSPRAWLLRGMPPERVAALARHV